jgi:hypothetical protein
MDCNLCLQLRNTSISVSRTTEMLYSDGITKFVNQSIGKLNECVKNFAVSIPDEVIGFFN